MAELPIPTPQAVRRRLRTFDALRSPTFRRLWAISAPYYTYRAMELAVLSWLVLELTDSPSMVALVAVSRMTPMFLLGLAAGSLADRFPRKRAMVSGQVANLTVVVGMTVVLFMDRPEPWHAYIIMFVAGCAWSVDFAARRSSMADIFKGPGLTNALSLDSGLLMGSNMLGPVIGTVLIRFVDFSGAYLGVAMLSATTLLLVVSLQGLQTHAAPVGSHESVASYMRGAIQMVRTNPTIRVAVQLTIVFNVFGWPVVYLVPVVARDVLGSSEVLYGLLAGAVGMGALIGAVVLASVTVKRKGSFYSLGAVGMIAAATAFALSPWYPLSLVMLLTAGIFMAGFGVMQPLIALEAVPSELRGRAMGAIAFGIGVQPVGTLAAGYLSELLGLQTGLTVMTVTGLVLILLMRLRYPMLRN